MLATVLISVFLAAVIALIVVKAVRDRKKGAVACGCGCSCCPMASACHAASANRKKPTLTGKG